MPSIFPRDIFAKVSRVSQRTVCVLEDFDWIASWDNEFNLGEICCTLQAIFHSWLTQFLLRLILPECVLNWQVLCSYFNPFQHQYPYRQALLLIWKTSSFEWMIHGEAMINSLYSNFEIWGPEPLAENICNSHFPLRNTVRLR